VFDGSMVRGESRKRLLIDVFVVLYDLEMGREVYDMVA